MTSLLQYALSYARKNWPVILCYGVRDGHCTCPKGRTCDNPGKHPIPECSQTNATTDVDTIVGWVDKYHTLLPNVGVLTGVASGICVLDVDPRSGGDTSIDALTQKHTALPITLTAHTGGGGEHFYFCLPSDLVITTSLSGVAPGIDVKANSESGKNPGYVLVPPSVTLKEYKWLNDQMPLADIPEWLQELMVFGDHDKKVRFENVQEVGEGQRHDFLLSRAGKLRHDNWSPDSILQALITENLSKCKPPLAEDEVKQIAYGITKYESPLFRLNDVGNAKRLIYRYGSQLRHCWQQKTWYVWEGRYWCKDTVGHMQQFAKSTVEWMHEDASLKGGELGGQLRKHASQSGRADRIGAMLEMARSEKEVSVRADDLDQYPLLLNCPNCTVDLEKGVGIPHDPKLLITKMTPTPFEPDARSAIWEQFLEDTTQGDLELATFLQRISGYALSGLTTEEYIFFVYGPGGTGKSTYFETIKAVMGDNYCKTAAFATFLKTKQAGGNSPRSDIARLPGARLVTAVETEDGKQFASDLLKVSTGGDKMTTRDLYQSEFEFTPQYKLWFAANSKPRVRDDDSGLWRRLLLIPFFHVITTPNTKLKDTLKASRKDREGILAWAVRGFLDWQKSGWIVPTCVVNETKAYRNEMDSFNAWLDDSTQKVPEQQTTLKQLFENYDEWTQKQTAAVRESRVDTQKAFAAELEKRGYISQMQVVAGRPTKVYQGIMLIY